MFLVTKVGFGFLNKFFYNLILKKLLVKNRLPNPSRHINRRARNRWGVLVGSQQPVSLVGPSSVSRALRRRTTGCTSSSPLLQLLLFEVSTMGLRSSRDMMTFCVRLSRWEVVEVEGMTQDI